MRVKISTAALLIAAFVGTSFFFQGCRQAGPETAPGNGAQSSQISEPDKAPESAAELNGYLTEGLVPEGLQYKDRLYIGGENDYHIIDAEGNLVRWGTNWDNWDMGWDQGGSADIIPQPFSQRSVLVRRAVKYVRSFSASFVLDENHDLWAWSGNDAWPLGDAEEELPCNEPRIVMPSVKDIAASDFSAAIVMEDGTLRLWGGGKGLEAPVDVRKDAEKVFQTRGGYYTINAAGQLYRMDFVLPDAPGGSSQPAVEFTLLDGEVSEIADLDGSFAGDLLVLKKDGAVVLLNDRDDPPTVTPLAERARAVNSSGFVSAEGDYWRILTDSGRYAGMEKEANTVWAVYSFTGDSIRILKNGSIEARLNKNA